MSRRRNLLPAVMLLVSLASGRAAVDLAAVLTTAIDGREAVVLGFDRLASFPYEWPDGMATPHKQEIPAAIQAFNGKLATVQGFMMPLQLEEGKARQFVLVRNLASCCYGVPPNVNEYILVTMAEGVRPVMDTPITVAGTLQVGETYENGLLVGIYQLAGEKLVP